MRIQRRTNVNANTKTHDGIYCLITPKRFNEGERETGQKKEREGKRRKTRTILRGALWWTSCIIMLSLSYTQIYLTGKQMAIYEQQTLSGRNVWPMYYSAIHALKEGAYSSLVLKKATEYRAPTLVVETIIKVLKLPEFKDRPQDITLDFMLRLVKRESNFDHVAVSNKGARGLGQIMPKTAETFKRGSSHNLFDEYTNIWLSVKYLNYLFKRYEFVDEVIYQYGRAAVVLTAYNMGETRLDRLFRLRRGEFIKMDYANLVIGTRALTNIGM